MSTPAYPAIEVRMAELVIDGQHGSDFERIEQFLVGCRFHIPDVYATSPIDRLYDAIQRIAFEAPYVGICAIFMASVLVVKWLACCMHY